MRRLLACLTAALTLSLVSACGTSGTPADSDKVAITAAFYPLAFISERIGGDAVSVTTLAQPGAEPHDLELTPRQLADVHDAKLVVYLDGFQPAVDTAVKAEAADHSLDVGALVPRLQGTDEDGHPAKDPHLWLDPTRLATIGDALARRLGEVDPAHAADYTTRAAKLHADLAELDMEYATGLSKCQRQAIVTGHEAFGYLADRYNLKQIGLAGLDPEIEPTPQRLAEVAAAARSTGATTIFFETLVSPKIAETIAKEVGAKTAVLDPIEGLEQGSSGDYISIMRSNLTTLREALGCS
ncbi:zinc transport system substrate-binding protein [Allocatelliglobosispora scoriae]|uniref:Zinc transport system substrate-binding protein n=1 Tax=Allocatelliglobosispora scoriae TaxID=643052 RepID=A0A841BKW5_9ACTN|nr:metal ABC transporter substrate-binding protein [Allocatelliglobosispora scoriae]MBB5869737.1 zinc transport system substrate-binding protein [Allocatelliglobosispora scoriae]